MKKLSIVSLAFVAALAFSAPTAEAGPRGRVSFSAGSGGFSFSAGRSSHRGSVSFSVSSPRTSRYHHSGWSSPRYRSTSNWCAPAPRRHYTPTRSYTVRRYNHYPSHYYTNTYSSHYSSYDPYPTTYVSYNRGNSRDYYRSSSRHSTYRSSPRYDSRDRYYVNTRSSHGYHRPSSNRQVYYSSCY